MRIQFSYLLHYLSILSLHRLKPTCKSRVLPRVIVIGVLVMSNTSVQSQGLLATATKINMPQTTAREVLAALNEVESIHFSYSGSSLDLGTAITIPARNMTVKEILDILAERLNMEYEIRGKQIVLKKKKAQSSTISGYIRDSASGEELIGATISIHELEGTGSVTNVYGFYSMTIPDGNYSLIVQYMGYRAQTRQLALNADVTLDFELQSEFSELEEVIISVDQPNNNVVRNQMGIEKISASEMEKIPVIFGEKDILKTLQLRPGIKSSGEGSSGFYVRGGGADQNLILLDEATIYNASHLLGFFSVFNADAIKDVSLYKGTQPAEYGGRLSSVLDMRMNEGNNKEFKASGGIGLIASRINVEGPLVKDKSSFMVSARRTYIDALMGFSSNEKLKDSKLYFYDINAKVNYRISDKDRLYLSGYFGRDVAGYSDLFGFDWGNTSGTLRWNHLINNKLFSNTSFTYSNYDYNIDIDLQGSDALITSRIRDFNFKQDFEYFPSIQNQFKFGLASVYHNIIPGSISMISEGEQTDESVSRRYAWENAAYFSHEYKPNESFSLNYGMRLSLFTPVGPGDFYSYDPDGAFTDTTSYKKGEFVKTYVNVEPIITTNYVIDPQNSIKASYTRNTQNLHLLSNSTAGSFTDLWIPSSKNVKPEISDQISLGYFRNLKNNTYEFSAELYYKHMQNQIDYKDGAELNFNENVESELLFGKGRAYGAEFFLRKKTGKLTGWIGYTLSRTEKKIDSINDGNYYAAKQDRTHDISVVGIYDVSPKWSFSATWVYYTGNAVTMPSGKYQINGEVVNYITERNGYRMPDYHRLDLGATWHRKKTKKIESSWSFSLYNAYGRENAYAINFQKSESDPTRSEAVQTSLFRWIPSITYNFKF